MILAPQSAKYRGNNNILLIPSHIAPKASLIDSIVPPKSIRWDHVSATNKTCIYVVAKCSAVSYFKSGYTQNLYPVTPKPPSSYKHSCQSSQLQTEPFISTLPIPSTRFDFLLFVSHNIKHLSVYVHHSVPSWLGCTATSPFSSVTRTRSVSRIWPLIIIIAIGFKITFWIVRFNGRAP